MLDGIKAAVPQGGPDRPDRQTAVQETGSADAVVAVVGPRQPYAEGLGDNPQLRLPGGQQALIGWRRPASR